MNFEASVEIDATPSHVWAVLTDVEAWPTWTESVRRVERLDDGPFAVGSRARIKQPRLPAVVWEVTEVEPERSFAWSNSSAGLTTVAGHVVRANDAHGATFTNSITQTGPLASLLGWLIGGMTRRYLQMEAQGLKRRCESNTEPRDRGAT